ncbi:MAG: zinc-ribbon domain-containing protein, partial [Candidatus Krumholzibacteriia bacterium]
MITTCTGCQTRYRLDDGRVPRRRIRVRCPRCEAVFALDGTQAAAAIAPAAPVEEGLVLERSGGGPFNAPPPAAAGGATPR